MGLLGNNGGDAVLAQHMAANKNYRLGQQQLAQDDRQFNREMNFQDAQLDHNMQIDVAQQYLQQAQLELQNDAQQKDFFSQFAMLSEKSKIEQMKALGKESKKRNAVSPTAEKQYFKKSDEYDTFANEASLVSSLDNISKESLAKIVGPKGQIRTEMAKYIGKRMTMVSDEDMANAAKIDAVTNFITANRTALIAGPKSDRDIALIEGTNFNRGLTLEQFIAVKDAAKRRSEKILAEKKQRLYNLNPEAYERDFGQQIQTGGGFGTIEKAGDPSSRVGIGNVPGVAPSQAAPAQGGDYGVFSDLVPGGQ